MPTHGSDGWDRDVGAQRIHLYLEARRRHCSGAPPRPVSVHTLADVAGVPRSWSTETRKRRVRDAIDDLRRQGVPVMSHEGRPGYWLGEVVADHAAYEAALERCGIRRLMRARDDRRSRARADAAGQLGLFAA